MPVIFAPGTASTGTEAYTNNFVKLLSNNSMVEPVVLDIPDNLLDDIQTNAEFIAYSIGYVSKLAGNKNVSVVTWSQGSIDMQWAVKYWPSTRLIVSDFVAISPDINGTNIVGAAEMVQGTIPLPAALLQQESDSVLIATLRANGGDSAFVPTTTIYSGTDAVVMPQLGDTASGFFKQNNGVPAANYQLQVICGSNTPAGGNFTHEGVIYNPFTFAIAMDAFANSGPGEAKRLDLKRVCSTMLPPGLTPADQKATDDALSVSNSNVLAYIASGKDVKVEPMIRAYAAKDTPVGKMSNGITMTIANAEDELSDIIAGAA